MGVLAARLQVDMAEALALLRHYARDNNRQLSQIAADAVAGMMTANALTRPLNGLKPRIRITTSPLSFCASSTRGGINCAA